MRTTTTVSCKESSYNISHDRGQWGRWADPRLPGVDKDILDAMSQLPDISDNGKYFAENLMGFCNSFRPTGAVIRRVLVKKLRPADTSKFESVLPDPDLRMEEVPRTGQASRKDGLNAAYFAAVKKLCDEIEKLFPNVPDHNLLNKVIQRDDDLVDDYLH